MSKGFSVGDCISYIAIVRGRGVFLHTFRMKALHTDNYWEAYAYAAKKAKELNKVIKDLT